MNCRNHRNRSSRPTDASSEALLIDNAMDAEIMADVTFNGTDATLADMDPLPAGTMYTPANANVEYEDGVDADLAAVPEPSTLAMLGLTTTLAARRRGVRRV